MAIRMTCTGCDANLTLADNLSGKKVRCKKCGASVKVPEEDVDDVDDADDEEDERPAKKKKKKKKKADSSIGLIIAGIAVGLLLLVGGGVGAYFAFRGNPNDNRQAKAENKKSEEPGGQNKPQIFPKVEDGSPTKKGGSGVVNNVRGAVYRTTIRNDLANFHKMFALFVNETPKSQQTREKYLEYIKRDFKTGHDYIIEGYYRLNIKAQPGSTDIFAGERDEDNPGHLVVRCNGAIEYVPAAEWKKAMGL